MKFVPFEWKEGGSKSIDIPGSLLYGLSLVSIMYGASILPSLEGNYLRKEEDSSGFLEFSGARGSYGDLSFEDFRGTCLLSGDRVQSSLKGLLEHLPLEGGGTLVLRKEEKPEMDLFLRSSGTPLHRLKSVLPSLEALQPEGNLAWEILLRGTPKKSGSGGSSWNLPRPP